MSLTATINTITPIPDPSGSGTVYMQVDVIFNDSVSGYSQEKLYNFACSETPTQAAAVIRGDGTIIKNQLATIGSLQTFQGTVLTI